jgi:hypothetical protein
MHIHDGRGYLPLATGGGHDLEICCSFSGQLIQSGWEGCGAASSMLARLSRLLGSLWSSWYVSFLSTAPEKVNHSIGCRYIST